MIAETVCDGFPNRPEILRYVQDDEQDSRSTIALDGRRTGII